ncbi:MULTISPECIES: RnfABCDGE type electron transport complex subunit D [Leptotrichia]|uniref:RnfABCDGE type electron transport complex subunit D n=1 Tax=Leptotrichia TaxID=32067 RepID=UPI0015C0F5D6|nr:MULTISPECIES: RnfABCDGE type electron transport complex subunit D [Leptotrichia]NWO19231.1 RnfABCDGE type electron transport complex subunit D [Leptotrichia sp. oral taxon 223]
MFRSKKRELQENITKINIDILISLIPMLLVAFFVYEVTPVLVILSSVIAAELAEVIFSFFIQKNKETLKDLSGVTIGALTGLVLAPFTPLYVAAFAGAMATTFGKIIYKEIDKKIFNPVILGKLFVLTFFPAVLAPESAAWTDAEGLRVASDNISGLASLVLINKGIIGELSIAAMVIGAIYLLYRTKITWHIPVSFFVTIFFGYYITSNYNISVSTTLGEIVFMGIFVLTDSFTTPQHGLGKIFFGFLAGLSTIIFWFLGIQAEAIIYSVLILNPFTRPINTIFKPNVFGDEAVSFAEIIQGLGFAIIIVLLAFAVSYLHKFGFVPYIVYIYVVYGIWRLYNNR